jgi:hypothetical protein
MHQDMTEVFVSHLQRRRTGAPDTRLLSLADAMATPEVWKSLLFRSGDPLEVLQNLRRFINLRALTLEGAGLAEFPKALLDAVQLENLGLARNRIALIPDGVSALTGLCSLDLYGNALESLPEALACLTALTGIDVRGNPLGRVPRALLDLPGQRLDLPPFSGRLEVPVHLDAALQVKDLACRLVRSLADESGDFTHLELTIGPTPPDWGLACQLRWVGAVDGRTWLLIEWEDQGRLSGMQHLAYIGADGGIALAGLNEFCRVIGAVREAILARPQLDCLQAERLFGPDGQLSQQVVPIAPTPDFHVPQPVRPAVPTDPPPAPAVYEDALPCDVVISWPEGDHVLASRVRDLLAHGGRRCFRAYRESSAPHPWAERTRLAIESCAVVVMLHTASSLDAEALQTDAEQARACRKPILVVCFGGTHPQGRLSVLLRDARVIAATGRWEAELEADVQRILAALDPPDPVPTRGQ